MSLVLSVASLVSILFAAPQGSEPRATTNAAQSVARPVVDREHDVRGQPWTLDGRRVTVTRGDGREHVFFDRLIEATSVAPLTDRAALLLEPPNLLLAVDGDGDGFAERSAILASGLKGGSEILLTGDGWLYVLGTARRFRWDGERLERVDDLPGVLTAAAPTSSGDLVMVDRGELMLVPGDPGRDATGAIRAVPPRSLGVIASPPPVFRYGESNPFDGSLTFLVTEAGTFTRQPATGWRWRLTKDFTESPALAIPATIDLAALATLCTSPHLPQRRQAAEALVFQARQEKRTAAAAASLREGALRSPDATLRRLALSLLDRLGELTSSDLAGARADASALVRRFAASHGASSVHRDLAALLSDPAAGAQTEHALDAAIQVVHASPADAAAIDALVDAVHGHELTLIDRLRHQRVAGSTTWWGDALLDEALARAVGSPDPITLRRLLEWAAEAEARGDSMLSATFARAVFAFARPNGRKHSMVHLDRAPQGYPAFLKSSTGLAFAHVDAWIRWPQRSDVEAPPQAASLEELIDLGRQVYSTCLTCHGPAGRGQEGVYPPLAGSAYVTGDPERLAKIILHGLTGRIKVGSVEYAGLMPPPAIGGDEEIAAVMSYVRQAFGNDAGPVSAAQVRAVREKYRLRTTPWTASELEESSPETK